MYALAISGVVLNQEVNTESFTSGTLPEFFAKLQFNFFRFTKPEINLAMSQAFYYSLSNNGRFCFFCETDLDWELIKDLKLNFNFYNNYDSQPALIQEI